MRQRTQLCVPKEIGKAEEGKRGVDIFKKAHQHSALGVKTEDSVFFTSLPEFFPSPSPKVYTPNGPPHDISPCP